jgi:hypothetical protein
MWASFVFRRFVAVRCYLVILDTDHVTLSPSLTVKSQSIGVASTSRGFNNVDGILGYYFLLPVKAPYRLTQSPIRSIGPVDLTQGTIGGGTPVPTITDNLFKQGTITTESIGIFYQPSTSTGSIANGELTFGGIDSSKFLFLLN